jgi:hypothetical protein
MALLVKPRNPTSDGSREKTRIGSNTQTPQVQPVSIPKTADQKVIRYRTIGVVGDAITKTGHIKMGEIGGDNWAGQLSRVVGVLCAASIVYPSAIVKEPHDHRGFDILAKMRCKSPSHHCNLPKVRQAMNIKISTGASRPVSAFELFHVLCNLAFIHRHQYISPASCVKRCHICIWNNISTPAQCDCTCHTNPL